MATLYLGTICPTAWQDDWYLLSSITKEVRDWFSTASRRLLEEETCTCSYQAS